MDVLVIVTVAAIALAGWRVHVRIWPMARCRRCAGNGKNPGSNRARWGTCARCGGSGKRLRVGARTGR